MKLWPLRQIYAFEPNPRAFDALQYRIVMELFEINSILRRIVVPTFIQIKGTLKAFLKYYIHLPFLLLTGAGHAEHQKPYDIKIYQEYFQDILLVIYYANPHYETMDFIKQLYSPVFKNIVFFGDRTQYADIREFDHEYEDGDHGEVRIVYTRNGYYLTRWIKDVLIKYPGYKGYIFMQDDCIMQFWHFLNLDKSKIWYAEKFEWQPSQRNMAINQTINPQYPDWFNTGCGMPQLKNAFRDLLRLGLDEERDMLFSNLKENGVVSYIVDLFYLPSRFVGKALKLCDLFDRVFCEISIPTMFGAMDYLQNWEELSFWWATENSGEKLREEYEPHCYWLHPLKFSYEINRNFALNLFQEQFYNNLEPQ